MSNIGTVELLATINTTNYKKGAAEIDKTNQQIEKSGNKAAEGTSGSFVKMGAVMGAVAGAVQVAFTKVLSMITSTVGNAIKRVDTLNNSSRTFANMGFGANQVQKAMKALDGSIRGLPTSLDAAVRGVTLIAASTGDIAKSQKIFASVNNAVLGFGGTTEMVSNAVVQLSQDLAGGRITGMTWMSMLNSGLGPALNAIAKDMGITGKELKEGLSEGSISVEDFTAKLIKMNEKGGGGMKSFEQIAKDSTKGIGTGWTNMQTAITRGVASIIETIGTANISGAITSIGAGFESALKSLSSFIISAGKLASTIGEYLGPKLSELWLNIQALLPTLFTFLNTYIVPLINILGTGLVVAIGLVIDSITAWYGVLEPLIGFLNRHQTVTWALVSALTAYYVALKLIAAFTAFNAFINTAIGAMQLYKAQVIAANAQMSLFKVLMGTPFVLAIAVGAALLALAQVYRAVMAIRGAIEAVNEQKMAQESSQRSIDSATKGMQDLLRNGTPAQKARARNFFAKKSQGFATGGFTGRGASNAFAGIVHKGEYVIPKDAVDQSTGMPKGSQTETNVTVNVDMSGIMTRSVADERSVAKSLIETINQELRSKQLPQIGGGALSGGV